MRLSKKTISRYRLYAHSHVAPAKFMRVKLLQDIKNIGNKDDVVKVTPTVWLNLLQPRKIAVPITDAHIIRMELNQKRASDKHKNDLQDIFNAIKSLPILTLTRKFGPNKKMFGKVTPSNILELLKDALPTVHHKFIEDKGIGMLSNAVNGTSERSSNKSRVESDTAATPRVREDGTWEIRSCGRYTVSVMLEQGFPEVQFVLEVCAS